MKRLGVGLAVLVVVLTACTSPKFEDLTSVERGDGESAVVAEVRDPDSVTVYRNVDQFANINVVCINGDAIVSRSTTYDDFLVIHLAAGTHNLCS